MRRYFSVRPETANGDRSAQQPNRPADHELRKGVEFRCHNEHSPGREKDDRPNRQMSEEYDPQVCGSDGAAAADAIVVERYPDAVKTRWKKQWQRRPDQMANLQETREP